MAGDKELAAGLDLRQRLQDYAIQANVGAYLDGRGAAKAVDFVAEVAETVAVTVLSAGTATSLVAAKNAAKAGQASSRAAGALAHGAEEASAAVRAAVAVAEVVKVPARRGVQVLLRDGVSAVTSTARRLGKAIHAKIESGVSSVVHGWFKNTKLHDPLQGLANRLGFKACFAAGTPLLTPDGSKNVEDFAVGDWILSRDENDPAGAVAGRRVEAVHVREALVWELRVGRETIRTTAEHPFWVAGRGWTAVNELVEGDRLVGADGVEVVLGGVRATGSWETVYNVTVGEWHTYFVGASEWGWSAWAHNMKSCGVSEGNLPRGFHVVKQRSDNALHHVFPQEFRDWFLQRGIDIDEYSVSITRSVHEALHGGGNWRLGRKAWDKEWNREIMSRLRTQEKFLKGRRKLMPDEIITIGQDMLRDYKVDFDTWSKYMRKRAK